MYNDTLDIEWWTGHSNVCNTTHVRSGKYKTGQSSNIIYNNCIENSYHAINWLTR